MKKFFLKSVLIVAASVCCSAAWADGVVSGFVGDVAGEPLPYVTVAVLSVNDSTVLNGAITNADGSFSIANLADGNYLLSASFVGFNSEIRPISVSGTKLEQNFSLHEESTELAAVEVKAKRPLIENSMDKLVMNVAESAFAIGSSGEDLLKKAPGVSIDKDGNVTVNGKSVEVYIDGRPSYMSGQQLSAMLRGTDGTTIDKIEIITNPSAKYDASGQGGIINIKTKRNMSKGLNGSLTAAYGGMYFKPVDRYNQFDFVSLNLNYRGKNTYTFVNLSQVFNSSDVAFTTKTRQITPANDTISQKSVSPYSGAFRFYRLRVGNDWYIDDKNTLGFIVQVPVMQLSQHSEWASSTEIHKNSVLDFSSLADIQMPMSSRQHTANINYTHTFCDSLSRELTLNADYNRYNSLTQNTQRTRTILPDVNYRGIDISQKQVAQIASFKADFQTAFWKTGLIEAGVKYAMSRTDNQMETDSLFGEDFTSKDVSKIEFDYTEHVAAAYISVSKQFGPKFSVKLGLRGEYTYSLGNWISADTITTRSHFNLFPTVFLGYNPTDKWRMSLSYSRRIKRPNYDQLNPFVTYYDSHSTVKGNPELTPEFNNDVEMKFGYAQYVSLALNFAYTQSMFSQRNTLNSIGGQEMIWQNFGSCMSYGGSLGLTEIPVIHTKSDNTTWLTFTMNAGVWRIVNQSADKTYDQRSVFANFSGSLTAHLPKDVKMSVDGYYSLPCLTGYNRQSEYYNLGLAIRKGFLQNSLMLSLQFQDLIRMFANQKPVGEQKISTSWGTESMLGDRQQASYSQVAYAQFVSIGLTYTFGTQQRVKYRRVGNFDEDSRLGSSGNQMNSK